MTLNFKWSKTSQKHREKKDTAHSSKNRVAYSFISAKVALGQGLLRDTEREKRVHNDKGVISAGQGSSVSVPDKEFQNR